MAVSSSDERDPRDLQPKERPPRVLIADDSRTICAIIKGALTRQGYVVDLAFDGREALEKLASFAPDLVILDVYMPEMSGLMVTRAMRAQPQYNATPILLITGMKDQGNKLDGFAAGASDFLAKPFDEVELVARVDSHLRNKNLHDKLQASAALLERVLTHYVSADVARDIMEDPDKKLRLGGQAANVTVMFADIGGFTRFSEFRDATEVLDVLNFVFRNLAPIVMDCGGTLDKYLGDCMMAVFGAPKTSPDDAERAVRAAALIQSRFRGLTAERPILEALSLRIGICTGEAVVGNVGSEVLMDYTVIGNIPNTAKRIEGKAASGQILVDTATREAAAGVANFGAAMPLDLKGRSEPVPAFEVLGLKDGA